MNILKSFNFNKKYKKYIIIIIINKLLMKKIYYTVLAIIKDILSLYNGSITNNR